MSTDPATQAPQNRTAVIIPYYENVDTIDRVLDCLANSVTPVDVFLIDDCSPVPATDFSERFMDRMSLTVIRLEKNGGNTAALNAGLEIVLRRGYEFVAVNDGDDYSRPNRFVRQEQFLNDNPTVGAVGGCAQAISETDHQPLYEFRYPQDDQSLRKYLRHNNPIVHPTIMFRAAALQATGPYDVTLNGSHDYDMMFRISQAYELANLPDIVLDYTIRENSFSVSRRREQVWKRIRIQWRYFSMLQWRAWAGLLKSFILLPIPAGLLNNIKSALRSRSSRLTQAEIS